MLFGNDEIEIMANAVQLTLREPTYSDVAYKRIFQDFFCTRDLRGSEILELGPGQYDFARLVEAAGAKVVGIDHDPAVVALGQKRGYEVIHENFRSFDWGSLAAQFDGLFCRGSINAFWFSEPETLAEFVNNICSVLKPEGWGWITPWNANPTTPTPGFIREILQAQRQSFERHGFRSYEPTPEIAGRYNISVKENTIVFLRNIDHGQHLGTR